MRFMVLNVVGISLCHFQTSLTEAGCDFLTAELNLHRWEETISAQLMNMPLPNSDDFRMNITLYFEDTSICVRVDNVLWSDVLIISLTSLFPPLPPFADPKPATSIYSPLSHSLCFSSFFLSYSLFSFGLRYGWDHNYVLTHGVSPQSARILTQSGSCQCDSPCCS